MDSGIYWSMIETKEVYSKNRLSKHVYSRKNAFYGDMSICITTLALPIRRTFEYSRTNQGFDSTNLWRHMIRRIHDSASNIRIFGFDRIKMPFTAYGDYQPNFNRQFIANVTRLSVRNIQIVRTSDLSAWIVDSAANAFITPFKERVHNYRHFKEDVQVKGFDAKPEMAVGSGSITSTDNCGNRLTLNGVVYVPQCTEQILSLMKLQRLYGADFVFTSLEEFEIPFPNVVFFSGKSVNDVFYIWKSTSLVSNAITTHSASKKRKILEIDDHIEDVEDVEKIEDINSQ